MMESSHKQRPPAFPAERGIFLSLRFGVLPIGILMEFASLGVVGCFCGCSMICTLLNEGYLTGMARLGLLMSKYTQDAIIRSNMRRVVPGVIIRTCHVCEISFPALFWRRLWSKVDATDAKHSRLQSLVS